MPSIATKKAARANAYKDIDCDALVQIMLNLISDHAGISRSDKTCICGFDGSDEQICFAAILHEVFQLSVAEIEQFIPEQNAGAEYLLSCHRAMIQMKYAEYVTLFEGVKYKIAASGIASQVHEKGCDTRAQAKNRVMH